MDTLPEELRKGPVGVIQDNVVLYTSAYLPDKPGTLPPKEGEFGEFDEKDSALMVAFTTLRNSFPEDLNEVKDMKEHCLGLVKHWNPKMFVFPSSDTFRSLQGC